MPLCLENWVLSSRALVPFDGAVQAFFSAGLYDHDAMTVMSVWGDQSDPAAARYGGREALLKAFLSTMAVWPESTPREDRVVREVPGSSSGCLFFWSGLPPRPGWRCSSPRRPSRADAPPARPRTSTSRSRLAPAHRRGQDEGLRLKRPRLRAA